MKLRVIFTSLHCVSAWTVPPLPPHSPRGPSSFSEIAPGPGRGGRAEGAGGRPPDNSKMGTVLLLNLLFDFQATSDEQDT